MTRCACLAVLALGAAAGCHRSDSTLTAEVQSKVNTSVPQTANIEVQVDDGVVLLSGTVPTAPVKEQAEHAAAQIDGVKGVKDDLKVTQITGAAANAPPP